MKIPSEETKCSLIAKTALEHYRDVLPKKGKPTPRKEWTVFAASVATSQYHTDKSTDENNNDGRNNSNKAHDVMQSTLPSHPTFLNSYTSMYNWDRELMSASRVAGEI